MAPLYDFIVGVTPEGKLLKDTGVGRDWKLSADSMNLTRHIRSGIEGGDPMSTDKGSAKLKPDFNVPPRACDAHFHVFGPADKYPYAPDLRYAPPVALLKDYLVLSHQLGLERMVFVQPSAYGRDNSCMLEAMVAMGKRCRGIVDVDETISDKELRNLHDLGVRGMRINVSPVKTYEAGFADRLTGRIKRLSEHAKGMGWHVQFLSPGWLVQELMPLLRRLPVPFVIDHMGVFPAREGIQNPGFQELLDLVGDGDNGPGLN